MEVLFAWEGFWEGSSRNCDELARESENERNTRKGRIDPRLDALGWKLRAGVEVPINQPYRTEEEEASTGPADYALWLDHKIVAWERPRNSD
jgi:predicted type IV restriction endonuclease